VRGRRLWVRVGTRRIYGPDGGAPSFLARGLVRGAYIGTKAASAVVMHLVKLVVFGAIALLTPSGAAIGLALAPATTAGAWAGKRIVDRLPRTVFVPLVEVGLLVVGLLLVVTGRPAAVGARPGSPLAAPARADRVSSDGPGEAGPGRSAPPTFQDDAFGRARSCRC
jgi:hypothetical protein